MLKLHCQFTAGNAAVLYVNDHSFWRSWIADALGMSLTSPLKWSTAGIAYIKEAVVDYSPQGHPRYYLNTEMDRLRFRLAAAESLVLSREIHDLVGDDAKLRDYAEKLLCVLQQLCVLQRLDDTMWEEGQFEAMVRDLTQEAQTLGIRATVQPSQPPTWSLTPPANDKVTAAMAEVMRALEGDDIGSVVYDHHGHWQYRDGDGTACIFKGCGVDVQPLNDAADSLGGHPAVFFVVWE